MVMMTVPKAAEPSETPALHVLIIGGGASGVLLAAHLLRRDHSPANVTIIEKRGLLGCGIAYSTTDPNHLLNTRVANMSAFRHDPDDFLNWLTAQGKSANKFDFVSRATYGQYLSCLLDGWKDSPRLRCMLADCTHLTERPNGVLAHLSDGRVIAGDKVVLATGHALPDAQSDPMLTQPWARMTTGTQDEHVLIVGSGLTMVDQVLSLLNNGHTGPITAISRRGLLSQVHAPTDPICIPLADVPLGSLSKLLLWFRRRTKAHVAAGGDWRDVVDGLRPHLQTIWRHLPLSSRSIFLRHGAPWWDVHRHRMPPSSRAALDAAIASGQLVLLRGAFNEAQRDDEGRIIASISTPGNRSHRRMTVSRIIDCRGIRRDPEAHATPLIADLLQSGVARIDALRLGLDVDADCAIIRPDNRPHDRISAIGPVSRAAFWEITAIPDIREQVARLASNLSPELMA